jgi:iron complex outermembrane receptor protein
MKTRHADLLCALVCVPCLATQAVAADNGRAANPAPAAAGNELEEVIVTAERRTVDIQNVATSVSVRTGEELAAQGRYTTRQVLEDIPGFLAVDNNSRNTGSADVQGNNITIRGIAAQNSAAGGVSGISAAAGAAVYVDGVYEGIGSGYDIERVEALRGPQGTLYGRSATTGVVAFHTRNPSMDGFNGNASVEVGNYDLTHYTAAVNVPLSNTFAMRVSGDYYKQDQGYYSQATRGQGTRTNARAKMLWKPNDTFSLLVGAAYEKREAFGGGTSYTALLPTYTLRITNAIVYPGTKDSRQYWAEANWDLGAVTLTYLPAYRTWVQDDTQISTNFFNTGQNSRTSQTTPIDHFLTHELRVASKDDARVKWQGGFFYYHNNLNNNVLQQYETVAGVKGAILSQSNDLKDTLNQGVFAETTIPFTDSLRVTLGARYDDTKVVVNESLYQDPYMLCGNNIGVIAPLPPGQACTGPGTGNAPLPPATTINVPLTFHNFSYKARLEYDLTPKNMLYAMASSGFRPGDAGVSNGAANILPAEKLTSFELGSKNRFLDDSLQVNAGVYFYDYQAFHTFYQTNIFIPISFVNVAVPAHNIGGEVEVQYRLTAHDRIGLDGSYVQSRWYDKPAGFALAYPQTKRAMTPYTFNANYQHVFNLSNGSTVNARIDGRYEAAHASTDLQAQYLAIGQDQYVQLGSRIIGNLSVGWTSDGGRYSASAYVRNFTNKRYTGYTVSTTLTQLGVNYSDPRTYGAILSARF